MSSVNVVLRKKANKFGQFPIAVRITRNRRSIYLYTGQYIEKKYWDSKKLNVRSSHPNSARLNHLILTKLTEASEKLLENESAKRKLSVGKLKESIQRQNSCDFKTMADVYLNNIKARKKSNQYITEKNRVDLFLSFAGNGIEFHEIDVPLLKNFAAYIEFKRKRAKRTVVNYMICIRAIYNLALAANKADRNDYPFGKGKYQIKIPDAKKIGLTIEELKKLENAQDLNEANQHVLNVWLLSFYFAGVRITDIIQLKWTDLKDNRLYYRMRKNDKLVSLQIPTKAQKILDLYLPKKSKTSDLVFPELRCTNLDDEIEVRTRVKTITRNFNRQLGRISEKLKIEKKLTMHIARHSFGNISGDKISIQLLQQLYRHSSITTTMMYQSNFINKQTDDALNNVVDF
ncbi:site-specific integrase [Salegentibacter sp. LM13S]|uniref:tyrosine-type recombinase/integrase n=1 Tax=Salegentibacter lacus TaxID=2873599 RepID=UPI001CC951C6|nr:tyrosine-type recombinase/integrase [Salegentibacter lacus]MBZ9631899.1 site-specific integrase [Salegentibacter lacus]